MAGHDPDIASLTYEEARDELVAIVAKLEAGAATLEESLELWERGEALAARCQELLDGARDRITATRGSNDEVADGLADAGVIGIIPADQEDNA
ncbi:MAG: exodeoxyribonuclease VII small subunit [Demequina sp.]|uniref:exodeoxyribonuclease VII small subunit n=1 Tax=Demequina sp. TaxID=2050685 RepID=UPI003A87C270